MRLLGDVTLSRGGSQVRRLRSNKYGFLLAYLCLHPDRAFGREELIELFWPDCDIGNGRVCLRTALASLRRQLDSPDLFMEGNVALVRINRCRVTTDVEDFEKAVRRHSHTAVDLYGGELMPGCYEDWAMLERSRLELLYEQAQCFPAPSTANPVPASRAFQSSVPSPASHFSGRTTEVEETLDAVSNHRLVSLVGLGGMGKTRIAIQVGRTFVDRQRVFFLDLLKIKEPFEINGLAADTIGLERAPFETLDDRLTSFLGQEPTLLILDNFDQLVETEDGPGWIGKKLSVLASLKVLVTTRLPLDLDGEQILPVGPMGREDAREMFIERARSVLPDFPRSEWLDPLCRLLEGIPLAIVLCAPRVSVLTAREILRELDRRFEVLQTDRRSVDPRHGSLRTVLEWSCPVGTPLHSALSNLAVFTGSWTLSAASAVLCGTAVDLVSELRQRCLVRVEPADHENRFSMMQTVREYALETGDPATVQAARELHADFFLDRANHLAELHGTDQWAAFRGLDAESNNIFAAFEFGLSSDPARELRTLKTVRYAAWALSVRGYRRSLVNVYQLSEGMISGRPFGEIQTRHLRLSAEAAGFRGEVGLALQRLDSAAEQFLTLELPSLAAESMNVAAGYCLRLEDWQGAIDRIARQIEYMQPRDESAMNIALASLAHVYVLKGDFDQAQSLYQKLRTYWESQSDAAGHIAMIDRGLSACLASTGYLGEAISLLEGCVGVFQQMGLTYWEVKSWEDLARLYRAVGSSERSDFADLQLRTLHEPI